MHCFCMSSSNTSLHWWCGCPIVRILNPGYCIPTVSSSQVNVFLCKTRHSDSQCLNPPWNRNEYGYHWTVSKAWWNAGVLSAMDWHPILGEWQLIQCIYSQSVCCAKNYDDVKLPLWGHSAQELISVFLDLDFFSAF